MGGFGLFILGHEAAAFTRWTDLVLPACLAFQGLCLAAFSGQTSQTRG